MEPYNLLAPLTENGMRCAAGCAAISLAQILAYYQYPFQWNGSHSWVSEGEGYLNQEFTVDFSESIQWDKLRDNYVSGEYSEEEAHAVALLMKYCAAVLEMSYGYPASGAYMQCLLPGPDNLLIDPNIECLQRCYYNVSDWNHMVYQELSIGRPLNYNGYDPYTGNGHSFICDGYDGDGYFHFNMGEDGYFDGYYRLQAIDIGHQIYGTQFVLRGICPPQRELTLPNKWNIYESSCSENQLVLFIDNTRRVAEKATLIGSFYDNDTDILAGEKEWQVEAGDDLTTIMLPIEDMEEIGSAFPDGNYYILFRKRTADGKETDVRIRQTIMPFLVKSGGSLSWLNTWSGTVEYLTSPQISDTETVSYRGDTIHIKLGLNYNSGTVNGQPLSFAGSIRFDLIPETGDPVLLTEKTLYLPLGESEINITAILGSDIPEGKYRISPEIKRESYPSVISWNGSIEKLPQITVKEKFSLESIRITPEYPQSGQEATLTVVLKNVSKRVVTEQFYAAIYPENPGYPLQKFSEFEMLIEPGQTISKEIPFTPNLEEGKYRMLLFDMSNNLIGDPFPFALKSDPTGIIDTENPEFQIRVNIMQDELYLTTSQPIVRYEIHNMQGILLDYSSGLFTTNTCIGMGNYLKGIYILSVYSRTEKKTIRILKK